MCIVISFFGPFVAFLDSIPGCVMGGVCVTLYGFIAVSGLKMIQQVDLNQNKNLFVVASILIPGIGGMKFTSSDFYQLERLRTAFPDHIFYNGSDEMLLSGLAAGADGGIGTTYNYQPERMVNIRKAFLANDIKGARKLQSEANQTIEVILRHGVLVSTKKLLELMGMPVGVCREPIMPLSDEMVADLRENALPLLSTDWLK